MLPSDFHEVEPEDLMLKQELTLYSITVNDWSCVLHETVSCTFLVYKNCENSQFHWIYLISYEKLRSFENEMELIALQSCNLMPFFIVVYWNCENKTLKCCLTKITKLSTNIQLTCNPDRSSQTLQNYTANTRI